MTLTWGLVATVKAPEDKVLAFIAHHLALGAEHLWIYFDDPDDPAYARVAKLARVTATRCTDWYWLLRGGRYNQVERRQKVNARHAQRKCKLDWLGHIDVDEFLHAPRPVADILGDVPATIQHVRLDVFEAIHDPDLPDDIYTARHFRGALLHDHAFLQPLIFGPMARLMETGCLGHNLGKSFCRPSAPGVSLGVHNVRVGEQVLRTAFHPELQLLHFHAQDPVRWRQELPYRLSRGAYRGPSQRLLREHLTGASDEVIRQFYDATMTLTPEKIRLLRDNGKLVTADLALRARVADLLDGRLG